MNRRTVALFAWFEGCVIGFSAAMIFGGPDWVVAGSCALVNLFGLVAIAALCKASPRGLDQ